MPDTMSATGTPTIADDAEVAGNGYSEVALGFDDEHKILPWFENMVSFGLHKADFRLFDSNPTPRESLSRSRSPADCVAAAFVFP